MLNKTRGSRLHPNQSGVSLIEILVALFTLSIGLLGLATMQSKTLQLNQSAYQRTQATLLAKDIIDRIRANGENVTAYTTPFSGSTPPDCTGSSANCDSNTIAQADLSAWQDLVEEKINGDGSVVFNETTNTSHIYDISITWTDRDGNQRTFLTKAPFSL